MYSFEIYRADANEPNSSKPDGRGAESVLASIIIRKKDNGSYDAELNINDSFMGGGTLTRELKKDIFVRDFDKFIENLCRATSVSWFLPDAENMKKKPGIREFFGY